MDLVNNFDKPSLYGTSRQERLFNVAMELCITWINRILFLKLLEAQLLSYHKKDKAYEFLSIARVPNYDVLNKLFFQVLAKKHDERSESVNRDFGAVPFLNSSLFETSEVEQKTLRISGLEPDLKIPVLTSTVLKNDNGKRIFGELDPLEYLFRFLNAYDFSSEGSEEIQEENKSLINASVLGLIFEKINGYKDGSFFTPGFITMYMCRETLRRAVVSKFLEPLKDHTPQPFGGKNLTPQPPLQNGEGERELPPTVETGLPKELLAFARELRKNQTEVEDTLWQLLRNRKLGGFKFRRQHPISEGFILDFYCAEVRLAIELDGAYHKEEKQREYDEGRTYELEKFGIKVIRFWNNEIEKDIEIVLTIILKEATQRRMDAAAKPPLHFGEGARG